MTRTKRAPSIGYVVLAVTDTALAAAGTDRPRWFTKPLLMPTLMAGRERPTQLALGLSGAGDIALLGKSPAAFTAGLGCFLGGQVAWISALRRRGSQGALARQPALALPVVSAWCGLNAYLWHRTGPDRVPVLVYSTLLAAMALTALDTGDPVTATGGVLFMTSDSLIALDRFGDARLPAHEGWVMATYTIAQALLAA